MLLFATIISFLLGLYLVRKIVVIADQAEALHRSANDVPLGVTTKQLQQKFATRNEAIAKEWMAIALAPLAFTCFITFMILSVLLFSV